MAQQNRSFGKTFHVVEVKSKDVTDTFTLGQTMPSLTMEAVLDEITGG